MTMQFESFNEFLAMGGHGLYVWLAYGATLAVLLFSSIALRVARAKQLQALRWAAAQTEQQAGAASAGRESAAGSLQEPSAEDKHQGSSEDESQT